MFEPPAAADLVRGDLVADATRQPAAAASSTDTTPPAPDGEWPRRYIALDGALIVLYEPQIASWENQKRMTLHAAVAYTPKGHQAPVLGTIIAEADTRVSVAERLVDFSSFTITRSNFPTASREQASEIVSAIKGSMRMDERVIALDRVLAALDASTIRPVHVEGLKADPPVVFFSMRPAVVVNIDGDPIWSPIADNDLRFAVNTNWDLFEHGPAKAFYLRHEKTWLTATSVSGPWTAAGPLPGSFLKLPADDNYLCFQGVWFLSRTPAGPWEVTGTIPRQIYEIPPSSPAHNVTYVTVEDDDDEWAVFATAAAYTGLMVGWGCVVWGTGYYYPPCVWYGGFYPGYFPYYPTYGYGARYNPWTGSYGRGVAAYGPYGGTGVGARYNPRTGTYSRGAAAYGPYGARGYADAYNPRTGTYGATRQGSGVYGSWGSTGVRRGDTWATTSRATNRVTDTTTRVTRGSEGGAAVSRRGPQGEGFVGTTGGGDVYAGRDGSVYRKQGDSWQKHESGGWNSVDPQPSQRNRAAQGTPDSSTMGQLDRDSAARREGSQRTRDASTARSGSSGARSGSYRPSGGMRGGGRRR